MLAWPLLLALVACSGSPEPGGEAKTDEEKKPVVDPRTLVEVAPVTRGAVGQHLVSSASVESESQATLVPETAGVVSALYVEEGDRVTKGQRLATLVAPTLDGAWERAQSQVQTAQADAETARRLFDQGAIAKAELDAANRALDLARSAGREAGRTRGFGELTSPIDGVVATRNMRVGEMAGPTSAIVVVDPARLRVVVNLPERDIARVHEGLAASLTSSFDDKAVAPGRVVRVSPVVDATSGTFRVTVALDDSATKLRPGQFVSVRIEVDRHEGVLTIPRRALVWEEGKAYLFKVVEQTAEELAKEKEEAEKKKAEAKKAEGFSFDSLWGAKEEEAEPEPPPPHRKAVRLAVDVGFEDGENAEILSGAVEGDSVVTVGNSALRDGAKVRLPGDPTLTDAPK